MYIFPATSKAAIARLVAREAEMRGRNDQLGFDTTHHLNREAGTYCRTVVVPGGHEIIGVLIKIPTTVLVSGDCFVHVGDGWLHLLGPHNLISASAERKQHFVANEDTHISMFFPSKARTVDEAEREFTDEFQNLLSRRLMTDDKTVITGE